MVRTTIAMSVRGDREFANYIYILARELELPVTDVIRNALEDKHSGRLGQIREALNVSRETMSPASGGRYTK